MTTMRNWMLGIALVAGLGITGAVVANAAPGEFGWHHDRDDRGGEWFHRGGWDHRGNEGFRNYGVPDNRAYGYGGGYVDQNYIPPCPGEGYVWTAGYNNGGYWVPGQWVFRGSQEGYGNGFYQRHFDGDERRFEGRRDFDRRDGFRR